jgi:large subunit ribosomal protein L21
LGFPIHAGSGSLFVNGKSWDWGLEPGTETVSGGLSMYAVVDIAGSQYKVQEGDHIRVARIDAEEGASLTLPHVLLVGGSDEIKVGTPQVEGAAVEALVKGHGRADKITVFKMKRRKTYRRKNGHRQSYTELQIEKIVA